MKRFPTFLCLSLIYLLAGCSSTEQVTVYQPEEPITVDGSLSGWDTTASLLKESDDIRYFAAVQDDFLHLFIDVRSPFKENTIRQLGLIVYLSNSESNRKDVGIAYPAGTFNLLRENPGAFNSFTTDREWSQNRENVELINELSENIFSQIMIIERPDGSNAEYGFVDRSMLEIDGFEIYADEEQSRLSIEMKIPINSSSVFNIQRDNLWLGFAIEPPRFRYRDENNTSSTQRRRGAYGQRQPGMMRTQSRQSLPSEEEWFILNIE
jgi:hypothetical protein